MDAYKFLMHGGYAHIYYDAKKNSICKSLSKRVRGGVYSYSTMLDTIFSASLSGINGVPTCHYVLLDEKTVKIIMDYQGHTLLKWLSEHDLPSRRSMCIGIVMGLLEVLLNLQYNGIQHTDLKPSNVLINAQRDVHLIDFNCMSIEYIKDSSRKWVEGIGSWYYCAPEVIFHNAPSDTSMVWSIALIFCCLWYKFPIARSIMKRFSSKHIPEQQSEWRQIYAHMQKHCSSTTALVWREMIKELPSDTYEFLSRMLSWDPLKRPSLQEVYVYFKQEPITCIHLTRLEWMSHPNRISQERREVAIQRSYDLCISLQAPHLFTHTVVLFDRCYELINGGGPHPCNPATLETGCLVLVAFLHNMQIFDMQEYKKNVHESNDDVEMAICAIGQLLHWKLYQRSIEYILLKLGYSISHVALKNILMHQKDEYSPKSIAKRLSEQQ